MHSFNNLVAVIAHDGLNTNGRVYTRECLENMVSRINENPHQRPILIQQGCKSATLDLMLVAGRLSDARIVETDGRLEVEAIPHFLSTPQGKIAQLLLSDKTKLAVLPVGDGNIEQDGTVTNYNMTFATLVPADDSSFPFARIYQEVAA